MNKKALNLIKSKTLNQSLQKGTPNQKLMKALKLGDTKVKNGITYVVKLTPSGKLDWRVKDKKIVSKDPDDNNPVKIEDLFDHKDFPKSLNDVKEIGDLGGSTGAMLVEDKNGKKFVLKKGNSPEHCKEEFTTNCIYRIMNVETPNMKLYDKDGDVGILSEYLENTVVLNTVMDELYEEEVGENYVLDCFLANWDIYKNDNILIDESGEKLIRVDNGGGLRYSAQGRLKGVHFDDEVDELITMTQNNPNIGQHLKSTDIKKQIKKLLVRGNKIISLVQDDPELKDILYNRLMDLKDHVTDDGLKDPNRELKSRDLLKAYEATGNNILNSDSPNGWVFINELAKRRGFDGLPELLDDEEFDEELADDNNIYINRGISPYGNIKSKQLIKEFLESDQVFWGGKNGAIYGAGIYGAVNKAKNRDRDNSDFGVALQYGDYEEENVIDVLLSKDAKIIEATDLDKQMNEEFFGKDFKEKKKEYDDAKDEYYSLLKDKERIEDEIEFNVKKDLGWDEKSFRVLQKSRPERVYHAKGEYNFNKITNYYSVIMDRIGGSVDKIDDKTYNFKLSNGAEFLLNKDSADLGEKQKNENSYKYNYQYSLLRNFVNKNHFRDISIKVQKKLKKENQESDKLKDIGDKIKESDKKMKSISDAITTIQSNGTQNIKNEVLAEIVKRPGGEYRGFYAMLKGYDAIINKNGWGSSTDFAIILNRSKLKIRNVK